MQWLQAGDWAGLQPEWIALRRLSWASACCSSSLPPLWKRLLVWLIWMLLRQTRSSFEVTDSRRLEFLFTANFSSNRQVFGNNSHRQGQPCSYKTALTADPQSRLSATFRRCVIDGVEAWNSLRLAEHFPRGSLLTSWARHSRRWRSISWVIGHEMRRDAELHYFKSNFDPHYRNEERTESSPGSFCWLSAQRGKQLFQSWYLLIENCVYFAFSTSLLCVHASKVSQYKDSMDNLVIRHYIINNLNVGVYTPDNTVTAKRLRSVLLQQVVHQSKANQANELLLTPKDNIYSLLWWTNRKKHVK